MAAGKTSSSGSSGIRLEGGHTLLLLQGVTDGWAAQRDWVLPDGGVNTEFLARSFGDSSVMATDTSRCLNAFASFGAPGIVGADTRHQTISWTWQYFHRAEPARSMPASMLVACRVLRLIVPSGCVAGRRMGAECAAT